MALKGRDVHSTMREKLREVEASYDQLVSQIARNETRIADLVQARKTAIDRLAEIYLPELKEDIQTELREKQSAVERAVSQRRTARATLDRLVDENHSRRAKRQEELEAINQDMNAAGERIRSLKGSVAAELHELQEYQATKKSVETLSVKLNEDRKNLAQVKKSVPNKIEAYEKDPLFKYLLHCHYNTAHYDTNFLARRLDHWVAGKVEFDRQRQEYDLLRMLPEAIDERLATQGRDIEALQQNIADIEAQVTQKYGLTDALEEGKKLDGWRNSILDGLERLDTEYQRLQTELQDANSNKGSHYHEAISELKGYLAGETIQQLRQRAQKTRTTEDDTLVEQLENIENEIKGLKADTKRTRKEQEATSTQLSGLREIERHYTRQDYESSRSCFDNSFDMNALLTGYLLGNMTASDVTLGIDRAQHFQSSSSYSGYSSSSSSSSSSGDSGYSSGGGFDGGGFSSGGGFDSGGGFSTGGGF